jgi:enoyl-CoA hydratase/carnithine racemase
VFERLDAPPALSPEERQLLDSVRALDLPLPEGLKIEADLSTLAFQTADSVEGMTAVIKKRPPVFGDR